MRDADVRPGPLEDGALFFGETRYTSPLSWLAFSRRWVRLVSRMVRMRGHRGHRVYWTPSFALGTIAFFDTTDALLAMSRGPEHRELMVWLTASTRWATAGFIRFYEPIAADGDAADADTAGCPAGASSPADARSAEAPAADAPAGGVPAAGGPPHTEGESRAR